MRHSNAGGIFKYPGPRGRALYRVSIRYKDFNGRLQRYRESGFQTREQAETARDKKIRERFERPRPVMDGLTVREAWELYEPRAQVLDSYADAKTKAAHLLQHLGRIEVGPQSLNQGTIDAYRAKRRRELIRRRDKEGVLRDVPPSTSQLDHEVELLRRMLNYAVSCKRLELNPLAGVKLLDPGNKRNVRTAFLTEEQFQKVLAAALPWFRPILLMAFDHGFRKREVLDLTWSQLDLSEGRVTIWETKTDAPKVVHLTRRTREALALLPRARGDTPVFPNPKTGSPYRDVRVAWSKACLAAELVPGRHGVVFHDHRHSFATNARRYLIPSSVVMKMGGWKTEAMLKRYAIIDESDLREAARIIDARHASTTGVDKLPASTGSDSKGHEEATASGSRLGGKDGDAASS
jgi:integrase